MRVARSSVRYESKLLKKDTPARAAMSILSAQYPRYGYRHIHVLLARRGYQMGTDRAWRLWRQAGQQVPKKRQRVACSRPRPQAPSAAGDVWAYEFVFDACANGPEFVSKARLKWALGQNLNMALIDPGKPWQNGTAESFNGKCRDEC